MPENRRGHEERDDTEDDVAGPKSDHWIEQVFLTQVDSEEHQWIVNENDW